MSTTHHLPANLRLLRTRKKRSQDIVAEAIGVKRSSYAGYENGICEPKLDTLVAMGRYHRLSLDILLTTDLSTMRPGQVDELQRGY